MDIECWHFLPDDGCMRFGDRQKVEVGTTYQIDGPIALCERGFHGSRRALDALVYAPGALCCRVVIGGDIVEDKDKLVGQTRTVLWMADATRLLHEFSCDIAERYLKQNNITDVRCHQAIQVKHLWLDGKATDADLFAARVAAYDAAGDLAAAGVAAYDVGWGAVSAAIWAVTSGSAIAAAYNAAWEAVKAEAKAAAKQDVAWDTAWSELNDDLEGRLSGLAPQP